MSAFSGVRLLLRQLMTCPAVEKILSEGTDVAGTHRNCLASLATAGNRVSLLFHQTRAVTRAVTRLHVAHQSFETIAVDDT